MENNWSNVLAIAIVSTVSVNTFISGVANGANTSYSVSRPGVVAVDVEARRAILEKADAISLHCTSRSFPVPVFDDVDGGKGYGLDDRYNRVSEQFRASGSACLAGDAGACALIQNGALEWATKSKLNKPAAKRIMDDTLSINMRLITPLISALSVAEATAPLSVKNRQTIDSWLKRIVRNFQHGLRNKGRYKGGKDGTTARKAAHNHAMQSSVAAMSYGAWVGDDDAFNIGIEQWDITLQSMRADGSLPIETRRGSRALFYHGRALASLVEIAERASIQGIDLYGQSRKKSIHKGAEFFIAAVVDPSLVLKYAKRNYVPGPHKDYRKQDLGRGTSTYSWIAPYIARFPDHPNSKKLQSLTGKENALTAKISTAVKMNGNSAEWIGVNAKCFYATPAKGVDWAAMNLPERFSCWLNNAKKANLPSLPNRVEFDEAVSSIIASEKMLEISRLRFNRHIKHSKSLKNNKSAMFRLVTYDGSNDEFCKNPLE